MANELNPLLRELRKIARTRTVEVEVLQGLLGVVENRIFTEGLAADGSKIGTYSAGYVKFRQRKGLGSSSDVILQLTQQMRNDFSVVVEGTEAGLGFKNSKNTDKSYYVENTYNKPIFALTNSEQQLAGKLFEQAIKKKLG